MTFWRLSVLVHLPMLVMGIDRFLEANTLDARQTTLGSCADLKSERSQKEECPRLRRFVTSSPDVLRLLVDQNNTREVGQ